MSSSLFFYMRYLLLFKRVAVNTLGFCGVGFVCADGNCVERAEVCSAMVAALLNAATDALVFVCTFHLLSPPHKYYLRSK